MKTETKATHTPTPWRVRFEEFHGGYVISVPKNQSEIYKARGWDRDDGGGSGIAICLVPNGCAGEGDIAKTNAEFIVRAVNSHEELLEAVKDALCELDPDCKYDGANYNGEPSDKGNPRVQLILDLYRVIAKAEQ